MGYESEEHFNARQILVELGKSLGYIVEVPDEGEIFSETANKLEGIRPDVIWNLLSLPRNTAIDNLELDSGRIVFEVESVNSWEDIKRHIQNIIEKKFYVLQFFAVFYDGVLDPSKQKELRDYAKRLEPPIRIIFLFPFQIKQIENYLLSQRKNRDKLRKVSAILEISRSLKYASKSEILTKIINSIHKGKVTLSENDLSKREKDACENLGLGNFYKIDLGTPLYIFEPTDIGKKIFEGLGEIRPPEEKRYLSLPFFTKIKQVKAHLKQNEDIIKDCGINIDIILGEPFIELIMNHGISINEEYIAEALKIIKDKTIWNKILNDIIQL